MPRFTKIPVTIEARQFTLADSEEAARCYYEQTSCGRKQSALEEWCRGSVKGVAIPAAARELEIPTLEGDMRASVGDWIIKGVAGEFYPCKPDIFERTYRPAD